MLEYIRGITRPDGGMPLIGDADGSQIVPFVKRDADDTAYLLAIGAVIFNEPKFKGKASLTPEILCIFGEKGADAYTSLDTLAELPGSVAFPDAGAYVLRDGDLYLHFNANDCGVNGRGSHGHNDVLSIEVSAFGRPFIVDPGSYVYNLDRDARHRFRSTAYHSTVMVDGLEQNTTDPGIPFEMGNEARPEVVEWRTSGERDVVSAEHFGYRRLGNPISHRRTVEFNKGEKYWNIKDELSGKGEHEFSFSFHISPGLSISEIDDATVKISDDDKKALYVRAIGFNKKPQIAFGFVSRNYGHREESSMLKWELRAPAPFIALFIIVPSSPAEDVESKLELLRRLTENIEN